MPEPRTSPRTAQRHIPKIEWRARRTYSETAGEDKFYVPPHIIPPGMDWQWKRYTALGKVDEEHQVAMQRDGAWDPVPHQLWEDKLGRFGQKDQPIIIGGMMLMQRPMLYTLEAEAEQKRLADSAVKDQFASLSLSDGPLPKAKAQVKISYSGGLVPEDDVAE